MSSPAITGYTIDSCCGSGAFGSVWKAQWSGEFECAVKVLTPGTWHPHYLSWCLERLRKEGERSDLVRVYSYDLTNKPPHLSMALLPEGTMSLEQLAGRLPVREAWTLLDSLAATLSWLHGEGIVHTGLSGGNVFVCASPSGEPVVLLSDVGQGWLTGAPVARLHGQIGYIAPEHWRSATRLLQEGHALGRDVYAFGVIAWRLLTGTWPRGVKVFDSILSTRGEDLHLQAEPFADWLEKEPSTPWPADPVSDEEKARRAIVEQCLSFDIAERYSDMKAVQEVLKALALPPPAIATAIDPVAVEAGVEPATTGDAFDASAPAPRKRRFFLPMPGLSLRLKATREGARPFWRTALGPGTAVAAVLALAGVTAYAFKEREHRRTAQNDLAAALKAKEDLSTRLPRAENDAAAARNEAKAAREEQAAAERRHSLELVTKIISSQPVEDDQIPAWRLAVCVVADHCSAALENAPADAFGMEARWQLARLKAALGNEDGALPLLEKLTRDLEAAAIAAAGDFPPDLIRLTGRVEALTGRILATRNRTEEALPHLRKASDSFEKWVAGHADDLESLRTFAHNLYLEGTGMAERGQPDQGRSALMKIEGLIGKPGDSNFRAEDRFLLADTHFALGKLDVPAKPVEAEPGKEMDRSMDPAIGRYNDAIDLLLAYDKEDSKSIPCRTRLAKGYHEMGRLFVRSGSEGSARDGSVAYGESVKLYSELMREQPENAGYIMSLASVYNDAAGLVLATKPGAIGANEALEFQTFSVDFMRRLNENMPLDNPIRLLLAASLVLNGDLLQSAGETGKALKQHTESIALTADLLAESTLTEKERRDCRRVSARAWTGAAGLHERAGRRDDTVTALTKAYADWEFSPVEDPSDQKKMAWVKEKLDKLKPR